MNVNYIPYKNIPEGASTSRYVDKLTAFLERYLPDFPRERNVNSNQSENEITELLFVHLTRKAKFNAEGIEYPFAFQTEKSQKKRNQRGHSKRVDIAARLNTIDADMEVIYCVEAKKLPTDKPGGNREKEYVSGQGGAIARFKNEFHGLSDAGLLERNGIVAYICGNTFNHWHSRINEWIDEQGWEASEHLDVEFFGTIGKLASSHRRISGAWLHLTHFWVSIL